MARAAPRTLGLSGVSYDWPSLIHPQTALQLPASRQPHRTIGRAPPKTAGRASGGHSPSSSAKSALLSGASRAVGCLDRPQPPSLDASWCWNRKFQDASQDTAETGLALGRLSGGVPASRFLFLFVAIVTAAHPSQSCALGGFHLAP